MVEQSGDGKRKGRPVTPEEWLKRGIIAVAMFTGGWVAKTVYNTIPQEAEVYYVGNGFILDQNGNEFRLSDERNIPENANNGLADTQTLYLTGVLNQIQNTLGCELTNSEANDGGVYFRVVNRECFNDLAPLETIGEE